MGSSCVCVLVRARVRGVRWITRLLASGPSDWIGRRKKELKKKKTLNP